MGQMVEILFFVFEICCCCCGTFFNVFVEFVIILFVLCFGVLEARYMGS